MKLLMPEDLEGALPLSDAYLRLYGERARATIKALAERLARVELCGKCDGVGSGTFMKDMDLKTLGYRQCPYCKGTKFAHKDAAAALLSVQPPTEPKEEEKNP